MVSWFLLLLRFEIEQRFNLFCYFPNKNIFMHGLYQENCIKNILIYFDIPNVQA